MPGSSSVLDVVHRSCAEVASLHADHVRIDEPAAAALAAELVAAKEDVRGAVRGLPLPIKFGSLEQELTLLGLFHLLDFGSGYDAHLLRLPGRRTARECLTYGLLGLHLGGARLDHHRLTAFSMYDIVQVFGIEGKVEVPVMPGVTMAKPGPLHPLCKQLLAAINESGAILAEGGHSTLGELLLGIARDAGRGGASAFVEELVETLPAFRDVVLYDGRTLVLHRRAQALAADLAVVYGGRDSRLAFPDVDRLAADSGPVTIAVLRAKGVLRLSDEVAAIIDGGAELPAGPHERALRAAAVVACDRIVELAAAGAAPAVAQAPAEAAAAAPAPAAAQAPAEAAAAAAAEAAAAGTSGGGGGGEEAAPAAGASGAVEGQAEGTAESAGASNGEGQRAEGGGGGGGGAPFRAVDVGAYLSYLTEEGRPLYGKVTRHVTVGTMAY